MLAWGGGRKVGNYALEEGKGKKKSCKFYFNPKALHRNNRKGKRQLFCCLNDILVVFIPMEFMFIIFIYLLLHSHTSFQREKTKKKSHRVMPHRFFFSHGCFSGDVPRNNVKSFFKYTERCYLSHHPSWHNSYKTTFSFVLFIHFSNRENKRLLLFVTLFEVDTLCSVSSILRLMNLSICQLIAHQSDTISLRS